jgi:hypothetical protein
VQVVEKLLPRREISVSAAGPELPKITRKKIRGTFKQLSVRPSQSDVDAVQEELLKCGVQVVAKRPKKEK